MNASTVSPSRFRTWLQLFRAPNLFTVPGDPLAGFLLANSGRVDGSLVAVMFASLCFYGAGLLMNDLVDESEDRRERPNRPVPSGAARPGTVCATLWALNAAGLSALIFTNSPGPLVVGALIIVAVWFYNHVAKRRAGLGALSMGACRSLSFMLGATAGPLPFPQMAVPVAILFGLYIAAVTNLARHETRERVPILARLLPLVAILIPAAAMTQYALQSPAKLPGAAIFGAAVVAAIFLVVQLFRRPARALPPLIGAHIRLLLPMQAAICFVADPWDSGRVAAIVLLALWPLSRFVSRSFYAS